MKRGAIFKHKLGQTVGIFTTISKKLIPLTTALLLCGLQSTNRQNQKAFGHPGGSQLTTDQESSCSRSQRPQTQIHVVREPDGLGGGFSSVLARPGGSREVAEVVAHLERDHHVGLVVSLRDHFDEEAEFVGFPEGDDAGGESGRGG